MSEFSIVRARAAQRKGSDKTLTQLLTPVLSPKALSKIPDDRFLSVMTRCIFNAGFAWKVIEKKWPDFETAFHQFDIQKLLRLSPETWDQYAQDKRIVRNPQKILAVQNNAIFINHESAQHGSFGKFIAEWPSSDLVGLWAYLKKHGSRLGGNTGQYFLRFIGKDSFILSRDVVEALQIAGVEIKDNPTSKGDFQRAQDQFNAWHHETGLPYSHLSKIAGFSTGENYDPDLILQEMARHEGA